MLTRFLLSIAFLAVAACGGDSSSGLDGTAQAGQLSTSDEQALCEWSIAEAGGAGHVTECGDEITVSVGTVAECVEDFADFVDCDITVGELEACVNAFASDPCGFGGAA